MSVLKVVYQALCIVAIMAAMILIVQYYSDHNWPMVALHIAAVAVLVKRIEI